jgi:hypothetical protein
LKCFCKIYKKKIEKKIKKKREKEKRATGDLSACSPKRPTAQYFKIQNRYPSPPPLFADMWVPLVIPLLWTKITPALMAAAVISGDLIRPILSLIQRLSAPIKVAQISSLACTILFPL